MGFNSWIKGFILSSFSLEFFWDGARGGLMMALNLQVLILLQELG